MISRGVFGALVIVMLAPLSAGAQVGQDVTVAIEPASVSTSLGETESITVTVTNTGDAVVGPFAVHIDITDPSSESSVDPEDWTPNLTQQVSDLAPGESATVVWELQPISSGTFSVYAVALVPESAEVAVSNAVTVDVTSSRLLNPQGVLPVAVAVPLIVGAFLIVNLRRSANLRRGPSVGVVRRR